MTAAMPTPRSEKTSVSSANPAIGMLAPVLSANETPAADATAARTVVATEADGRGDAVLPDRLSLGGRGRRAGGYAGGDLGGGGHVVLRFLGGSPGATRSHPRHERAGTDPTGREKKCSAGSMSGDAATGRVGRESRP
jgi:hypothetical protein